jgi:hypothetical protein
MESFKSQLTTTDRLGNYCFSIHLGQVTEYELNLWIRTAFINIIF